MIHFVQLMLQFRCFCLGGAFSARRVLLSGSVFRGTAIRDFEAECVGDVYLGSDERSDMLCLPVCRFFSENQEYYVEYKNVDNLCYMFYSNIIENFNEVLKSRI